MRRLPGLAVRVQLLGQTSDARPEHQREAGVFAGEREWQEGRFAVYLGLSSSEPAKRMAHSRWQALDSKPNCNESSLARSPGRAVARTAAVTQQCSVGRAYQVIFGAACGRLGDSALPARHLVKFGCYRRRERSHPEYRIPLNDRLGGREFEFHPLRQQFKVTAPR